MFVSLLSFYHPWGYSVRLIIYLFIYFQAVSAALNVHGRVQCSRTQWEGAKEEGFGFCIVPFFFLLPASFLTFPIVSVSPLSYFMSPC